MQPPSVRNVFERLDKCLIEVLTHMKQARRGYLYRSARRAKVALTANALLYRYGLGQLSPRLTIYISGDGPVEHIRHVPISSAWLVKLDSGVSLQYRRLHSI